MILWLNQKRLYDVNHKFTSKPIFFNFFAMRALFATLYYAPEKWNSTQSVIIRLPSLFYNFELIALHFSCLEGTDF